MIEAVNSVLSNAPLLRGAIEQIDSSRAPAATAGATRDIEVPKAPFISPFISVDVNYNKAVLQIRDSDTGDVINQFPSQSRLQQIQRDARSSEQREIRAPDQPSSQVQAQESVSVQQTQTSNVSAPSTSAPSASTSSTSAPNVPDAQVASAALAAAAQTGVSALSAGVSVAA